MKTSLHGGRLCAALDQDVNARAALQSKKTLLFLNKNKQKDFCFLATGHKDVPAKSKPAAAEE